MRPQRKIVLDTAQEKPQKKSVILLEEPKEKCCLPLLLPSSVSEEEIKVKREEYLLEFFAYETIALPVELSDENETDSNSGHGTGSSSSEEGEGEEGAVPVEH